MGLNRLVTEDNELGDLPANDDATLETKQIFGQKKE
jgi:hypothetical protein